MPTLLLLLHPFRVTFNFAGAVEGRSVGSSRGICLRRHQGPVGVGRGHVLGLQQGVGRGGGGGHGGGRDGGGGGGGN